MKKHALSITLMALGGTAFAQVLPTLLYAPARTVAEQKITLQGWGSGTIAETDQIAYEGTTSIRVSSRNFFQGGTMFLGEPKDLAKKFDDKTNLLKVTFALEDAGFIFGKDEIESRRGSKGRDLIGTKGGGRASLGLGKPAEMRKLPALPFKPKIKTMRLIFTTTDGKKSEVYVPVGTSQNADQGWRSISVPLQAINGFDRTNKIVQNISLSTDTYATLYLGQINVVTDETPISGSIPGVTNLNMALGDKVALKAYGEGGSSVLVYEWDFDDRDGIQVDAEGWQVERKFRAPGKFKVTLTIRDMYDLKKPFVTSFPVTVNP
ncbi:MAG: hypothetical protein QOJ65_1212 [Fimbriimonadaceae bacterium]|nr:hypothetical protein [Fimbriimonadaceae bacterium]